MNTILFETISLLVLIISLWVFFRLIDQCSSQKLKLDIIISLSVIIVGWYVGYRLPVYLDLESKRRQQRIDMLVNTFRNLTKAYYHDTLAIKDDVQSALVDTQLLGTPAQAGLVRSFAQNAKDTQAANWENFDKIVESLRNDFRKELRLPAITDKVWWIRIEATKIPPNQRQGITSAAL